MTQFYQLRVLKTEYVTPTVKKFTLTTEEINLPSFGAGAHITVKLPMGTRQYSLTNDPYQEENEYTIAVKNIDSENSASTFLHEHIEEGDTLEVTGPDNYFPVRSEGKHHVFFAAGIGITPFLSMMAYLIQIDQSFELHYAGSSKEDCAFYKEIKNQYPKQTTFYFMEREQKVQQLREVLSNQTVGTHFYICGPAGFMDQYISYCNEIGYPDECVHSERFRPANTIINPKPFSVTIGKETIQVGSNQSLLQALNEEAIPVPYACQMGICGTCEVAVCNGEVLHNDTFLTDEERKMKMLSCVSRGIGDITIKI